MRFPAAHSHTHLIKFVSDVLPRLLAPLFDLPFKLLARVRNRQRSERGSGLLAGEQVSSAVEINQMTHLQVDCGRYPHVKADVHLCRDDVVGHASFDHGHVDGSYVAKCEALAGIQPEICTQGDLQLRLCQRKDSLVVLFSGEDCHCCSVHIRMHSFQAYSPL